MVRSNAIRTGGRKYFLQRRTPAETELTLEQHAPLRMSSSYRLPPVPCIMIMGNYLGASTVRKYTMATDRSSTGLYHVTVVPENFEPEQARSGDDEDGGCGSEK